MPLSIYSPHKITRNPHLQKDAMSNSITYRIGNNLDIDEIIGLYKASTLGERRPIDDRNCMIQMLKKADLVITAWDRKLLVGIARTLTDFCYAAYLSDLAVRTTHQKQGIGKELVRRTQQKLGPNASIILLAAPAAQEYYPKIGMKHHPSAWVLRPGMKITP